MGRLLAKVTEQVGGSTGVQSQLRLVLESQHDGAVDSPFLSSRPSATAPTPCTPTPLSSPPPHATTPAALHVREGRRKAINGSAPLELGLNPPALLSSIGGRPVPSVPASPPEKRMWETLLSQTKVSRAEGWTRRVRPHLSCWARLVPHTVSRPHPAVHPHSPIQAPAPTAHGWG